MNRRIAAFLGWLVAAGVATTIGLLAVSLLTDNLTSRSMAPLSGDAVARALASSTAHPDRAASTAAPTDPISAAPAPIDSPETPPSPFADPGVTRSLSSPGGTAIARCTGNTAFLVSWSPAQGYGVEDYVRGPAASTLIQFDGEDEAVTLTVACPAGEPVVAVVVTDD